MTNWTAEEFKDIDIGEQRLNRRAVKIVGHFYDKIGRSIPQAMIGRTDIQACYRFLDNDLVTSDKVLEPHTTRTMERAAEHQVVLLAADTTSLDFTGKSSIEGLGILEGKHSSGLLAHPTLAITPNRVCLGLTDLQFWTRDPEAHRRSDSAATRLAIPVEEKESFRWVKCYRHACELAERTKGTQFVSVFDREGDLADLLAEAAINSDDSGAQLLVRANHDRILIDGQYARNLKPELQKSPAIAYIEFDMPGASRSQRKPRSVRQSVHTAKVTFTVRRGKGKTLPKITMNAIAAIEDSPPEGEDPVVWYFLTTLPCECAEQAIQAIEYYRCRWEIETFFKVLKSGCKVEERSLRTCHRLENLTAIYCVVAWRVMYCMMLGRECPELSCDLLFDEAEWKSTWAVQRRGVPIPDEPPGLGKFMVIVATLGGYLNRKSDPPPGASLVWKGLQRVMDLAIGWECFGPGASEPSENPSSKTYA